MTQPITDTFTVINGPEDGTTFYVDRAPLTIGRDVSCAVRIRLDGTVEEFHARVMVVPDGYRIRSVGGAAVFVEGKRVGTIFSQICHPGQTLQIGQTLMCLECSPEGLAPRSRGMALESDFAWAMQVGVKCCFNIIRKILVRLLRFIRIKWIIFGIVVVILWPFLQSFWFRSANAMQWFGWVLNQIKSYLPGMH